MHVAAGNAPSVIVGRLAASPYRVGVLYAVGAGIALGTLGPVSNMAYAVGMSSPTFAALRATVGALALALLAGRDDGSGGGCYSPGTSSGSIPSAGLNPNTRARNASSARLAARFVSARRNPCPSPSNVIAT